MRDARLMLAAGASVALHALVVAGSLFAPSPSSAGAAPSPPSPQAPPPVRLGIQESDHVTLTWLGFQEPLPHDARRAETEQPLLALAQPEPAAAPEAAQPAAPDTPETPADVRAEQPPPPAEAMPVETPPTEPATEARQPEPAPAEAMNPAAWLASAADGLLPILERMAAATAPSNPAAGPSNPRSAPTPTSEAGPADPKPAPAESAASEAEAQPGNAEAEAEATSKKDPITWKPGQTAAAEGLEITTRLPAKLSIPAELLSARIRPVFDISFARDGSAKLVEVVRSSGNVNVDEPWVSALYRWRAKGPALDALDPGDPDAVVTIQIQILPP